jgi:acyl dehydratase
MTLSWHGAHWLRGSPGLRGGHRRQCLTAPVLLRFSDLCLQLARSASPEPVHCAPARGTAGEPDIDAAPNRTVHIFAQVGMLSVDKDELGDYVGQKLETSDWLTIDQERINAFADVTRDHQFIHVDEEKAARTPFGSTIAHGYLTMSLISYFATQCGIRPNGAQMGINYGSDKVRFLQPVKVGSRIRAHAVLLAVDEKAPGQVLLKTRFTVEIEGETKPAMVAEILSLFLLS